MQEWKQLASGPVLTGVEATAADLKASDAPFLYSRAYIPQPARVRVLVEIDGVAQVVFDDTVTPSQDKAGVFEVRVRHHPDIDPKAVPTDPAAAKRIEDGVVREE